MIALVRRPASDQPKRVPFLQRLLIGRNPKVTLLRAGLVGLVCWMTFRNVLLPVRVSGISMEPTLRNGSVNLINRLPYWWREPRRGEIVAIRTTGRSVMYLKRIIAMPNETVEIRAGHVIVNGEPLAEEYVKDPSPWEMEPRKLGSDEYLVFGDNRSMPMELHVAGVVKRHRIIGKAIWQGRPNP